MGKGKNIEKRCKALYKGPFDDQQKMRAYARRVLDAIDGEAAAPCDVEIMGILVQLKDAPPLTEQVYDQASRRVFMGENVPADEKQVSIFETRADVICRAKKGCKAEFGHKFDIAMGRSGLITRYEVFDGKPCDGAVLARALEDHRRVFGKAPQRLTADRRYHSETKNYESRDSDDPAPPAFSYGGAPGGLGRKQFHLTRRAEPAQPPACTAAGGRRKAPVRRPSAWAKASVT